MNSPDPVLKPNSTKSNDDAGIHVLGRALRALGVAWPVLLLIQILSAPAAWAARRHEFGGPEATRHFTRPSTFNITHVLLEVSFDAKQETLYGRATTSLTPLNDSLTSITLDAADLHIDSVLLASGELLAFQSADDQITIRLDRPYSATDTIAFTIVYSAQPRLGVYFVHPDKGYPDKPVQIWSQGEMEESRHWFPCYDAPNDFYTTEMMITVPEGQTAVSNGKLVATTDHPGARTVTYHWRTDVPHATYLTAFAVGEFKQFQDEWKGIPVQVYVDPAQADMAENSFARTPDMIRFFSNLIGYDYPYAKYAQVAVADFRWGGMENQSMTTLTDRTLRDAVALQDGNSEGLVAHELAHQWWGDLLTTVNWNNIWLNEGFATYFDALYTEYAHGPDEFLLQMLENRESYMREDSSRYRRAIVTDTYEDPEQMFDSHSYPKGAWVLNMIRYVLGEKRWEKAIHHYALKFARHSVDTEDFRKAIWEATGEPLDWFFDEWLYHGGHPEYDVSWDWDEEARQAAVHVRQGQAVDSLTPLFTMPVEIELTGAGASKRFRVQVTAADQTFFLPFPSRPDFVQFDPDERILKVLRFDKSREELQSQLSRSHSTGGRILAARGLARFPVPEAIAALTAAMTGDSCRGVRAEAALALGDMGTPEARAALAAGFNDSDARVRRKVAEAIGKFPHDPDALALLRLQFRRDSSYQTRAEVVRSAAKLKMPEAFEFCVDALRYDAYQDAIRRSALEGMAELSDKRGIDYALKWSAYGKPQEDRTAAVKALADLASTDEGRKPELRDRLIALLDDADFRVHLAAAEALGDLGDRAALAALGRMEDRSVDYREKRAARDAARKIREQDRGSGLAGVKSELDQIRDRQRDLDQRLERLERSNASGHSSEVSETKGAARP